MRLQWRARSVHRAHHGDQTSAWRASDFGVDLEDSCMKQLVVRFATDESAAAAIEYGLIFAGISVAIIAAVQGIGMKLVWMFASGQDAPE
jgi:pilus assembly protein Flp/PilA